MFADFFSGPWIASAICFIPTIASLKVYIVFAQQAFITVPKVPTRILFIPENFFDSLIRS